MFKSICLVTFMVCLAVSERISNQGSPTWERRTTEDPYGYSGRDRSPTFDRDQEVNLRPAGSSDYATDRPSGRFTYSWDRTEAPSRGSPTRESYLDRFTTERSASPYDRNRDSYSSGSDRDSGSSYDRYSSRRPSYATDRYGDVIGGQTTRRSGYVTMYTTNSWRDRDSDSRRPSAWDSRTTRSYGGLDRDRDRYDRNEAYLRIEFELIKLTNEKGVNIDGSKCDTFGACDPICFAYIDTERPNSDFPGARTDLKLFTQVFETDDNNSPTFTKANITREVCGDPFSSATARVYCEDKDSIGSSDMINKWDCPLSKDPEFSEVLASWTTGECRAQKQADKMKLTYRFKIHTIPRARCDPRVGGLPASGATTRRRT